MFRDFALLPRYLSLIPAPSQILQVMHRKQNTFIKESTSMFDRGILSADALCPELSNAVLVQHFAPQVVSKTAIHGSVTHIINGSVPQSLTGALPVHPDLDLDPSPPPIAPATLCPAAEEPCDCRNARHAIAEGSPDGVSSMGEAVVVNGMGYCRAVDASSATYLSTRSGPQVCTGVWNQSVSVLHRNHWAMSSCPMSR